MKFLLLVVLLLAAPGACASGSGDSSPSPTPPPAVAPPPKHSPAPPAESVTVSFIVEVFSPQGEELNKRVSMTMTGVKPDGTKANYEDPDNPGVFLPGPQVLYRSTPTRYDFTLTPGVVVAASITVDYFGVKGEIVQCIGIANLVEVSRHSAQITVVGSNGRGHAAAYCEYIGA